MKANIPLKVFLHLDQMEEFNSVYEPACRKLAAWFLTFPDKFIISNSGHAFRQETINTEGIWIFREMNGKRHSFPDHWFRMFFAGIKPEKLDNPDGTLSIRKPTDRTGPMNFLTPVFEKWGHVLPMDFEWLPYSQRVGEYG